MVRDGEFKQLLKYKPPFVLGHDVAGVVTQVGADVRGFTVGDEVYSRPRDLRIGTFAERIAIDADDVALKPRSLSFAEAGAVPLVALAAGRPWSTSPRSKPGQKVLVHAGAGGLGSTVIQVAKHLGAHVATTAHSNDQDKVRGLGADDVIDYTQQDFADVLSGYDVVLDSLGGPNLQKSLTVLKPGGLAISVVGPPDPAFARHWDRSPDLCAGHGRCSAARSAGRPMKPGVHYSFFFMHADGAQLKDAGQPCTTTAPCSPCLDSDLRLSTRPPGVDGLRRTRPHQSRQGRRHHGSNPRLTTTAASETYVLPARVPSRCAAAAYVRRPYRARWVVAWRQVVSSGQVAGSPRRVTGCPGPAVAAAPWIEGQRFECARAEGMPAWVGGVVLRRWCGQCYPGGVPRVSLVDHVAALVAAGVPEASGISPAELAAHAAVLPEVPGAVLAVHPSLAAPGRLAGLLRNEGRPGFVVADMTDVDDFAPISGLATPDLPLYLVLGPTRGDELRNASPVEALAAIRGQGAPR